jgi:RNA polymerase sigma-70 factor, ECF subfamily
MDSEDVAWLGSIAQGDQSALGELYACYQARLYRYLWPLLQGNPQMVEEVLQDTFLAIWQSAATFRGEARVATWIFRIAQRCAGRAQRGNARHTNGLTLSLSTLDEGVDHPSLAGHEEGTLTRLTLREALERLTDKQRAVMLLISVQGFTADEAAQILGVPLGTVKSRLHAARAQLINDPAIVAIEEANS